MGSRNLALDIPYLGRVSGSALGLNKGPLCAPLFPKPASLKTAEFLPQRTTSSNGGFQGAKHPN